MVGEARRARDHALRAGARHVAVGDHYLEAPVLVLLSRADNELQSGPGPTSCSDRRKPAARSSTPIGSATWAASTSVGLSPCNGLPSVERADESLERLGRLIGERSGFDLLGTAECLILRSWLRSLRLESETAQEDLVKYESIMDYYGNKVGLADALKERRIEIGVARNLLAAPQLVRRLRSATKLLRSARPTTPQRRALRPGQAAPRLGPRRWPTRRWCAPCSATPRLRRRSYRRSRVPAASGFREPGAHPPAPIPRTWPATSIPPVP